MESVTNQDHPLLRKSYRCLALLPPFGSRPKDAAIQRCVWFKAGDYTFCALEGDPEDLSFRGTIIDSNGNINRHLDRFFVREEDQGEIVVVAERDLRRAARSRAKRPRLTLYALEDVVAAALQALRGAKKIAAVTWVFDRNTSRICGSKQLFAIKGGRADQPEERR